ncbi:DUF2927 domain-containing protein [Celeribacter indicus]|uniref:Lipoprotein n=1 Tax=Celeribacter indicus TaxID=1208324 RepID=A0A0B5E193_9RHOB|nr:DUF2927 domain-containing protein [Celeribacter indicus]AJE46217.1 hypothetical protein P73_1502 [Celeribacter indicus]SDW50232.1 Protein of unknown function [Celeribacter indicus]
MRMAARAGQTLAGVALCLALSACAPKAPGIPPQTRPPTKAALPAPRPDPTVRSEESRLLEVYYARVQRDLLSNNLLRTDGGGPDAPFFARQLAANFDAIALHDEYTLVNGRYVAQAVPSNLHRWDVPVRIGLEFGPSVPEDRRQTDRRTLSSLIAQLARASGHQISLSARPNFHVLVLSEDERRAIGPRLAELIPGLGADTIRSIEDMPRSSYCLVIASDPKDDGAYRNAVAIIRAEHPDLLRQSCFHEELAQGLGLANDSPRARPSIFNDDEEFALLTRHDELLLRILYDPRLAPGMTPDIARPIATEIAYELMGEDI